MPKITFKKENQTIDVPVGTEFLPLFNNHPHLPLKFGCCKGICGKCAIKVEQGAENLTKVSSQELETLQKKDLPSDYRLACQCALNNDITIA